MRVLVDEFVSAGGLPTEDVPVSLAREGRAMRDAIRDDFTALDGIEVAAVSTGSAATFVERLAQALDGCEAALVVAPEFDGILARVHATVTAAGVRWIGCDSTAIAICSDKLRTHDWLVEHGVPTVPTRSHHESAFGSVDGGSWILKPRDGAGSLGIRRVEDAAALGAPGPPGDVVQPFVPGEAISVAAIVRSSRDYDLLPAGRQRLDAETFAYRGGSIPLEEPIADRVAGLACRVVETLPGLGGYVGIDLVLPTTNLDEPVVVEINPRLTTAYLGYRVLSTDNLAARMLGTSCGPVTFRAGVVEFDANGRVELRDADTIPHSGVPPLPRGSVS